jgi:hypothetical protein
MELLHFRKHFALALINNKWHDKKMEESPATRKHQAKHLLASAPIASRNKFFEWKMDLQGQSSLPAAHLVPRLGLQEAGANPLYMCTQPLGMCRLLPESYSRGVLQ